jgi:hypothetical protein
LAKLTPPYKNPGEPIGFRRLVWAPKVLNDAVPAERAGVAERDPLQVLARFDEQLPSDKVLGENLIQFIDFLHQHLDRSRPRAEVKQLVIPSGMKIFIDHASEDYEYATDLAAALQERSFEPWLVTLPDERRGDPRKYDAMNRKQMLDCEAIALCWGIADERWVKAEAFKINGWRNRAKLDQVQTTLLAAPPSNRGKDRWLRIRLPGIDRVVNMTKVEKPSLGDLDPLIGRAGREAAVGDD